MCLNPITIPNQSKYVSLRHRDRFMMQVPCGHCAECVSTLSKQWYFRAYTEFDDVMRAGGYVLFDTLTYRNEDLPRLSDVWQFLDKKSDFPCFNYLHIRNFLQNLRIRLFRLGYSKNAFRYFLASEYGTSSSHTHRPHIHIMLYVYDKSLKPEVLSRLIATIWKFGRTDGLPYKTKRYVLEHNTIKNTDKESSRLRTCMYITKYIQKSCLFQDALNKRIHKVMIALAQYADPVSPDKWLESEYARRERNRLLRYVNQFHRQSQHFGESALSDLDFEQICRDGCVYVPDSSRVVIPVPLCTYYKRKLFYDLVEYNGSRYWMLNDLGLEYNERRKPFIYQNLCSRYECLRLQYHLDDLQVGRLATYVLEERGRIKGDLPESRLVDRVDSIDLYNYSTCSDKLQFGERGLSSCWCGDSQQGYLRSKLPDCVTLPSFIAHYVYFDELLEKQLDKIACLTRDFSESRQKAYEKRQQLNDLYKTLCV